MAGLLGALVIKRNEGVPVDVLLNCIEPLRGCSANNASVAWWLQEHNISVRFCHVIGANIQRFYWLMANMASWVPTIGVRTHS